MTNSALPGQVQRATEQAARAGFTMSCHPDTGRLLAVLAAAVPSGGRVLELGTGTGVGTAWIIHGLAERCDVEVVTVELDPVTAAFASDNRWPDWVRITIGEGVDITSHSGSFDLIFADAPDSKWEGLDVTIAALRPGGHLLVDDMNPELAVDAQHEHETAEVRSQLHQHPGQASVEIAWSTGLILSTRRRQ